LQVRNTSKGPPTPMTPAHGLDITLDVDKQLANRNGDARSGCAADVAFDWLRR